MKKCAHCGCENAATSVKCQACGSVSFFEPVPPPLTPPAVSTERRDIDHLNLLSIFHFIIGFLSLCGIGFLYLHHYMMGFVMARVQADAAKHPNGPAHALSPEFMQFLNYFYIIAGIICVIASIVNVCSGVFLRQRKNRTFSFAVAGLNCLQIPFGTVLGIFTIVVLSRNSVRELYQKTDPR